MCARSRYSTTLNGAIIRDAARVTTSCTVPVRTRITLSHVLFSPDTEFIALLSSTTSSYNPTGNAKLPRLHVRGLANFGNMRFANAVLQFLMRSPAALRETRQSEGAARRGCSRDRWWRDRRHHRDEIHRTIFG